MKLENVSQILLSLCFLLLLGSCGGETGTELSIATRFQNIILVDAPGRSCTAQIKTPSVANDLSGLKALIGAINLQWDGEDKIEILYISFRFQLPAPDGQSTNEQEILLTGEEMSLALKGNGQRVLMDAKSKLNSADSSSCNLELGGINVGDRRQNAFGAGIVSVYAVTQVAEDEQPRAVQAQNSFSFQYEGIR